MPKYHILYKGWISRSPLYTTVHFANTETEARVWFDRHYAGEIVLIRKGLPFSKAEIKKQKDKLKYA